MAKNFKILRDQVRADPESRAPMDEYRRAMLDAMRLAELRESRCATQRDVADALDVSQANISRIEHQEDLYLSTLSNYVAALGGRLELNAVFPDCTVSLMPRQPADTTG